MIEQLFGSKTRVKLLRLFFSNPNRSFYVREITRKVDEQINSVRRELANLLALGLITSEEGSKTDGASNNKLYYEVNQKYEHYKALRSMFSEVAEVDEADEPAAEKQPKKQKATKPTKETKDESVELPEAKKWAKAGNISGLAYSGVYTRDKKSPVDILVIGDAVVSTVEAVIVELEKEKNVELRYAIIETGEWKYRSQVRDKFWLEFMAAKKQIVLDREQVFSKK